MYIYTHTYIYTYIYVYTQTSEFQSTVPHYNLAASPPHKQLLPDKEQLFLTGEASADEAKTAKKEDMRLHSSSPPALLCPDVWNQHFLAGASTGQASSREIWILPLGEIIDHAFKENEK